MRVLPGCNSRPHLGSVRLADLDGRTAQRVLDQICAHRVSRRRRLIKAGTVHRIWSVLRSALNEAHRQGLIAPIGRIRLLSGGPQDGCAVGPGTGGSMAGDRAAPPVAVWEVCHVARFIESVQGDPLFPLWWLVVVHGLRRGRWPRYAAPTSMSPAGVSGCASRSS
ncbi:hypothetical protein GCM10022225_53350 [Plantactinospora mayteni]|uniref:Uncharacterized protein n=1 Tax=Plantactinospora mayteni TaxID=566021 RepID=A0ABQ4EJR2_9ACTN|nr:hypothetical protein Pma05_15260 [Plantactinospora mayteni]